MGTSYYEGNNYQSLDTKSAVSKLCIKTYADVEIS
jgi:hypothetical protein